jgi:uncharacterized protein (TIGR01777 family)
MKIFVTGGTGFIGKILVHLLVQKGHSVTVLTRHPVKKDVSAEGIFFTEGDPLIPGPWQKNLKESDAVFNLAGASIFQRWTESHKKNILDSRIQTTRNIVDTLSQEKRGGAHLFNASAIGYYGYHGDEILDEEDSPGTDFLASVASQWESEAQKAEVFGVRVVLCRFGIVLGQNGGALSKLLPLFKSGLGSPLGSGRQWFSWIHEQDLAAILYHLLENKNYKGPVNCTAPQPVRNREMTKILGSTLKRPTILPPVPGFMLRLILGPFAENLLKGQRVVPAKLENQAFPFRFPGIRQAFADLVLD